MEEETSGWSFSQNDLVVGGRDVPGGERFIRRVHHRRSERDMENKDREKKTGRG